MSAAEDSASVGMAVESVCLLKRTYVFPTSEPLRTGPIGWSKCGDSSCEDELQRKNINKRKKKLTYVLRDCKYRVIQSRSLALQLVMQARVTRIHFRKSQ